MRRFMIVFALAVIASPFTLFAQTGSPITYTVTFPEPEHHWMQVEVTFPNLGTAPLQARMSRSSPGRYAVHEFAKNVFSVEAFGGKGQKLQATRPDPSQWTVAGHDGTVKLVYKIFGDHADGTYFGVDTTHAHLNIPAAFMWAVGLEERPIRITFTPPAGSNWKIGTQLFTTSDANTFTAPNLQYFMDSPTELSPFVLGKFDIPNTDGSTASFRLVVHSDGSQADVDELAKMVERMAREHMAVYGEFPKYEPGYYTFLLDYAPWGDGDGMEHRNSTSISSPGLSLKTPTGRRQAMGTISHEFFHGWNVERIRPVGLEPFDFRGANVTCCLWLAEGFTQYYGPLLLTRSGFSTTAPTSAANAVVNASGRSVRSAVQMSEYAPFSDAATSIDADDSSRTFLSYYTYGAGIALALDLSIRERTGGKQSLDDYMRMLWRAHGKSAEAKVGYVGKPYSLKDLRTLLGELVGNQQFAADFFDKYIEGREAADYERLLGLAGYVMRPLRPNTGWVGAFQVQDRNGGVEIMSLVPFNTPAYDAGLDLGDVVTMIDGQPGTVVAWNTIRTKKAGESIAITMKRRDGATVNKTLAVKQDPAFNFVQTETVGGTLTPAQKAFRDAWLGTKVK